MKYIFSVFFSVCLVATQAQNLKIVTSASMFKDMAENLAPDNFDIEAIVPIGGDPHKYNARPSDARMVQQADLILVNGLTFEGWIKEVIENSGTKAKTVTITEGITPISSLQYDNSSDPHAWMDAAHGLVYIENIKNTFLELAPDMADEINKNYEAYAQKLRSLDDKIKSEIQKIPENQRVLITSHDAFQYYGQRYGLQLEAIMGISTEAEAQTSDIIRVSKVIKENNIPAVFIESTINPKMLKQIAQDNKVKIGGQLYADSLGDEDSEAPTYEDMLWHNTTTIVEALSEIIPIKKEETKADNNEVPDLTSGLSKNMKILLAAILVLGMIGALIFKLRNNDPIS